MENKFNKEDIVYKRVNPSGNLVLGDFSDGVQYWRLPDNFRRQFVFQERELTPAVTPKGVEGLVL